MICVDTSVALAELLAEDRRPAESFWKETLVSSRLLEYEVWIRVHARKLGRSHGDAARALVGFAPMQFEGFLREVGEPAPERVLPPPLEGPPDIERLIAIGKRNGLEILGPPGPPPGH